MRYCWGASEEDVDNEAIGTSKEAEKPPKPVKITLCVSECVCACECVCVCLTMVVRGVPLYSTQQSRPFRA